ncbi:MAG: helix-turn-helix domain-containing protein [Candidatus Omnitrophica bacterium]|nr:helix-turn-helix domain-containing protein [Candidatus Omnitrophota bacterium]
MKKVKEYNKRKEMISAKEIANKYNVSYQTVNHYTDFGLLPVQTKIGNVRFYDKDMVEERINKIRELMGEGYSLRLIRKKLVGI